MGKQAQHFTLTDIVNDLQIPLYPKTIREQVIDWNIGDFCGPYSITLSANNWNNLQQTVDLSDIRSTDIPFCVKVLSGTTDEMLTQDKAYSMLSPTTGIESLDGQVRFTCSREVPSIDMQVLVYWTR